jgi:Histidine phosphatase superfamily (branch 2)
MRIHNSSETFWPLAIVVLLFFLLPATTTKAFDLQKTWYTKYPAYPPYCSTPEQMATRKIPPLKLGPAANVGTSKIVHASVILRHGARTPFGDSLNCWEDYWTNPETGVWDCNLTSWISLPPPEEVTVEGGEASTGKAMFFFDKHYDALTYLTSKTSNFLGGTCQNGQLILQGYEQEIQNGKSLREAYIQINEDHDPSMTLIDNRPGKKRSKHGIWKSLYYRMDDDPRTLMSGQVLLRGLFGPELEAFFGKLNEYPVVDLHTADYARDIMVPNPKICPRLSEIQEALENSADFKAKFVESEEAKTLKDFMVKVLKVKKDKDMDIIDCLMTTMCTDRPLPEAVNDYKPLGSGRQQSSAKGRGEYGSNLFQRLVDFETEKTSHIFKANDAEYSKLAMAPLWHEILGKIEPHLRGDRSASPLAVFSGHNTTIMPLLASLSPTLLDDNAWPPYASMIVLEIHAVTGELEHFFPSMYAFRLIFNGQSLTEKVEQCNEGMDLCDSAVLLNHVKRFSNLDQIDCGLPPGGIIGFDMSSTENIKTQQQEMNCAKPSHGMVTLAFTCLIGFLLGFFCKNLGRQFLRYVTIFAVGHDYKTDYEHDVVRDQESDLTVECVAVSNGGKID